MKRNQIDSETFNFLHHSSHTNGPERTKLYDIDFEPAYTNLSCKIRSMLASFDPNPSKHIENINRLQASFYFTFAWALQLYCYHFKLSFKIYDPKDPQECKIYLSQCMVDRLAMHGINLDEIKEKASE